MTNVPRVQGWWLPAVAAATIVVFCCSACSRTIVREPWETALLAQEPVERVQLEDLSGLELERIRFRSEATGDLRFLLALTPKGEAPPDEVLILIHGWKDRPESLLSSLDAARIYSDLLARRTVRPAILVLPDLRFDDRYRRNSEDYPFPQYLSLVGDEVYRIVSRLYSISPDRAKWHIGGFSFGGYVSLDVGRRYAARFGSVGVISAFADSQWSYWPVDSPAPGRLDDHGRGKHTLVDPGPVPRLHLACGTGDRFYPRMVELHERLDSLGIPHSWLVGSGGHGFGYWKAVLEPALIFHLGTKGQK